MRGDRRIPRGGYLAGLTVRGGASEAEREEYHLKFLIREVRSGLLKEALLATLPLRKSALPVRTYCVVCGAEIDPDFQLSHSKQRVTTRCSSCKGVSLSPKSGTIRYCWICRGVYTYEEYVRSQETGGTDLTWSHWRAHTACKHVMMEASEARDREIAVEQEVIMTDLERIRRIVESRVTDEKRRRHVLREVLRDAAR